MATKRVKKVVATEENRDPITGEPGAHPVGTGIGAALGGAAAGAAAGAVGGPIGAVVGAVAGGVGGGLAGKAAAESIDPTAEYAYWEETYQSRPYYDREYIYDDYAPAYRTGWEARSLYPQSDWNDVEEDVEGHWEKTRENSKLTWAHAKDAARDAWDRVAERERNRRASNID
jgi:phage tail tape-measure protein